MADQCKECGRAGVALCTFCNVDQVRLLFRAMLVIAMRKKRLP